MKHLRILIIMIALCFFSIDSIDAYTISDRRLAHLDAQHSDTITLELVDVDLKQVMQAFSHQTGINVILADDISGPTTVNLNNVTPVKALEAILRSKGFNWYVSDNQTVVVTAQSNALTQTFELQFIDADNLKATLDGILEGDLALVSVNHDTNSIVVKADLDNMRRISETIATLDRFPEQVVIEAHIVEIKMREDEKLGFQWSVNVDPNLPFDTLNQAGTVAQGIATTGTFGGQAGLFGTALIYQDKIQVLFNALEERDDFNLLASPKLLVQNHKTANILVGDKLGFKTTTTTQTSSSESVEFLEVGTRLEVTPHISSSGFIRLIIHPEVSSGSINAAGVPDERTTETTTEVVVGDTQTLVLGGLIRDESTMIEKGVPLLMHIPLLGLLFKRQIQTIEKREILIFIKPTRMTPAVAANMKNEALEMLRHRERNLDARHENELEEAGFDYIGLEKWRTDH